MQGWHFNQAKVTSFKFFAIHYMPIVLLFDTTQSKAPTVTKNTHTYTHKIGHGVNQNKWDQFPFFYGSAAPCGPGSLPHRGFTITFKHTTLGRTPLHEGSDRHTELWEHKQYSQETDIHAPGGIRTRNPCKQVAADPQLKRRGHLDRQIKPVPRHNF